MNVQHFYGDAVRIDLNSDEADRLSSVLGAEPSNFTDEDHKFVDDLLKKL